MLYCMTSCYSIQSHLSDLYFRTALGSFFPVLLLSGIIWPLERSVVHHTLEASPLHKYCSIPVPLIWLSYAMPTTWGAEAMRSVMVRGWGLEKEGVWIGFVAVLAWMLFFIILAVVGIKRTT